MKHFWKRLLCLSFLLFLAAQGGTAAAAEVTKELTVTGSGYSSFGFLHDGKINTYKSSSGSASVTLSHPEGLAGLYLMFDLEYGAYTVTDNATGASFTAGQQGFLHDYLDLTAAFGTAPTSVTLDFSGGKVRLSEIRAFTQGELPDDVQRWSAPLEGKADLVLFATHGDDDQLYFAGLLPYFAGELKYGVQVVYLTDHRNLTNARTHEMLNGLWSVGVTAYPVFGDFADFRIDSLEKTYSTYKNTYNTTKDELLSFVVEQIRRFKPLVSVGHDLKGEYGHGMHQVYADLLTQALSVTGDASQFPQSAEKYGVWEMPKLYLHLYEENPVVLDYDKPLEAFEGLTAFQVTQKYGFPCHRSQQDTMFTPWLYGRNKEITKATQISKYNPCKFGLYHSAVGADGNKDGFFENITTYEEQARLEQERLEQERLEQERLEQERLEQERLEQERLEQERLEQERLEQERLEQERLERERLEKEQQRLEREKKRHILETVLLTATVTFFLTALLLLLLGQRKRK